MLKAKEKARARSAPLVESSSSLSAKEKENPEVRTTINNIPINLRVKVWTLTNPIRAGTRKVRKVKVKDMPQTRPVRQMPTGAAKAKRARKESPASPALPCLLARDTLPRAQQSQSLLAELRLLPLHQHQSKSPRLMMPTTNKAGKVMMVTTTLPPMIPIMATPGTTAGKMTSTTMIKVKAPHSLATTPTGTMVRSILKNGGLSRLLPG